MSDQPFTLVTGAGGFLGNRIVREALRAGLAVRGFSLEQPEETGIEWRAGDVRDVGAVTSALQGANLVIHAAGLAHVFRPTTEHEARMFAVNAEGTKNVVRAAVKCGVSRVVLVSTMAVYGNSSAGIRDEQAACEPASAYGRSKLLAEESAIQLAAGTATKVVVLRLATLYGEGDPGNMARLIQLIDRRRFLWIGDGGNQKSFLHVSDAARGCVLAATAPRCGERYNIAVEPCSLRQIVEAICHSLGIAVPRLRLPKGFVLSTARAISSLSMGNNRLKTIARELAKLTGDDVFSGALFQRELGFSGRVELEDGLKEEVQWYKARPLAEIRPQQV